MPAFGQVRLLDLSPRHVSWLMTTLLDERGVIANTAQHVRTTLRIALNAAIKHGVIRRNAAAAVHSAARCPQAGGYLNTEQAEYFLGACQGLPLGNLYLVIVGLGLRRSEALGLWGAVNLDRRFLRVDSLHPEIAP